MMQKFSEGTQVMVRENANEDRNEHRGVVRGIAFDYGWCKFYIVELLDSISERYPYTCGAFIDSSMRECIHTH